MAELRINTTGKLSLFDADDSHAASIVAGTVTANENVMSLATAGVTFAADAIIGDDLTLSSDSAVVSFGADADTTLTHTDGTGLTLNSTNKLCFNDASQFIQGSSNAILSLGATDEIDLTATAVDLNGTLDVSGAMTAAAITASGIIKTDDTTAATSTTDGSLQTDGGLSVALDAVVGDDLLMLSDASVIHFGADSEITLTHVADTGINIKHTATADDKPIVLTLQTGETDMAANDVIGKIAFQAPDEGTGTDAILVSAAIQAVAEGDHSSSSNATSLQFMTGASEAAAKKLTVTSAGNVLIGCDAPIQSGYDANSTKLCIHDGSGSAQSGYLELSSTANTNGYNAGAIVFANNANADATNHDADGKTVAQIRSHIVTSDSNAGDDSGGEITFWSKIEAGSLSEKMRIYQNGMVQFAPGTNSRYYKIDPDVDSFYPTVNDVSDIGYANLKWDDIYATNDTIQTSDKNTKDNITTSDLGLDFVNKLKPVSYKFKEKTRTHYGLIAQDIEDVLSDISKSTTDFAGFIKTQKEDHSVWTKDDPETQGDNPTAEIGHLKNPLGTKIDGEYSYGLRYEEFISPIVKAIQELATKVKTLEDA